MSLVLKKARIGGGCCDCPSDNNPCNCGDCPAVIECRSRGGLLSLCGEPEFGTPSTPPRYYRRCTGGGSLVVEQGCDGTGGTRTTTLSGSFRFNELCVASSDLVVNDNGTLSPQNHCYDINGLSPLLIITETKTRRQAGIPDTLCRESAGVFTKFQSCDIFTQKQDEDSEFNTISRFRTLNSFGLWHVADGSCPDCCTASWQLRVSGRNFTYKEVEWRLKFPALEGGVHYQVRVDVERRVLGSSDDWVVMQTEVIEFLAAGTETIVDGGLLPNASGYETRVVACSSLTKVP